MNERNLPTSRCRRAHYRLAACTLALCCGAHAGLAQPAWTSLQLEGPGASSQVAFDPQQPSVAYAAWFPVARSADAGLYWRPATNQGLPPFLDVETLVVAPNRHLFLFGGTESSNLLAESADRAESWRPIRLPEPLADWCTARCGSPPLVLSFDPGHADTFYLAGPPGLFRTQTHGQSWEPVATPGLDPTSVAVDPLSPRRLYVGFRNARQGAGLYLTSDGGTTWARALRGAPQLVEVSPVSAAVVWTVLWGSVVTSTDRGAHWSTALATGYYPTSALERPPFLADTADASTAYFGNRRSASRGLEAVKTTDAGMHWRAITTGLPPQFVLALAQSPVDPSRLLMSGSGGLYRSRDRGQTWSLGGFGLVDIKVTALAAAPDGRLYATDNNSLLRQTSGGGWDRVLSGPIEPLGGALAIDPSDAQTIYSGVVNSGIEDGVGVLYKSTDGGTNWEDLEVPGAIYVDDLVIDPHDPRTLYLSALTDGAGWSGVFKSVDAGATWAPLAPAGGGGELALDPSSHPSTLYLANGGLLRSRDGGATWETVEVAVAGQPVHEVTHLALAPRAPQVLYVLSEEGGAIVARSADGGATWSFFAPPRPPALAPPRDSRHPLAVDPTDASILFAGWSSGVTRSIDGAPWTEVGVDLPPSPIETLLLTGGRLLVGTANAGAFGIALDSLPARAGTR